MKRTPARKNSGATRRREGSSLQEFAGSWLCERVPWPEFLVARSVLREVSHVLSNVNYLNEIQKIALTETRLHIPLLEDEEGTHGAMFPRANVFPEGLAIRSTFHMPLVKRIYAAQVAKNIVEGAQGGNLDAKDKVVAPGTPLYSFSYGLSYTDFQYKNLLMDPARSPKEVWPK